MEYQIPIWIALISLIIGGLAGMFAIGLAAIGKRSDLEFNLITEREKREAVEKKLKQSLTESLRLKERNIELREFYTKLKTRFIKLDNELIKLKDILEIENTEQLIKGD